MTFKQKDWYRYRILDTKTQLVWLICPCESSNYLYAETWVDHLKVCNPGWKIPTTEELNEFFSELPGFSTCSFWTTDIRDSLGLHRPIAVKKR